MSATSPSRPLIVVLLAFALVAVPAAAAVPIGPEAATMQANEQPTAAFDYSPDEPEPSETIVLNASASSDPDGEIAEYRWDFDNDGQVDATGGPNRRLAFPRAGDYPVTLTVVDDDGATDSTTVTVTVVGDEPPTASLSVSPTQVTVGEQVTLDPAGSGDPDGQIVSWAYDLDGDGTFERSFDAPTTFRTNFNESGEVEVTLRVTDNDGMTATASATVVVEPRDTPTTTTTTSAAGPTTEGPGGAGSDDGVAPGGGFPWALVGGGLLGLLVLAGAGVALVRLRGESSSPVRNPPRGGQASTGLTATLGRLVGALVLVLVFVVAPAFAIDRTVLVGPVQLGGFGAALVQLVALGLLAVLGVVWLLFGLVDGRTESVRRGPVIGPLSGDGFRWVVLAFAFLAASLLALGLATLLLAAGLPSPVMVAGGLILGGVTVVPLVLAFVLVTLALD